MKAFHAPTYRSSELITVIDFLQFEIKTKNENRYDIYFFVSLYNFVSDPYCIFRPSPLLNPKFVFYSGITCENIIFLRTLIRIH